MIGTTINNYTLESKLGDGGMGDVYLARHNRVDRTVAIKILHNNLFSNESIRNRFKNEANALIKLEHPNIVKIYDYIEQEDIACLIMEYIEGFTLDDFINKFSGPLPDAKATHIICSVLDAVQYAHDKNIFHRDIKPGNIMVGRDGKTVKIMDFSIAKFTDKSNLNVTHINAQLGTPFYMSPEQVKGVPISGSSDIYSLGVTLFEMVTGKCPYMGITNLFDLHAKIVNEPLPPTNSYYPGVSSRLQEAITIATNKIPEQRFKSCNEFKRYLLKEEQIQTTLKPVLQKPQVQQLPRKNVKVQTTRPKVNPENRTNNSWLFLAGAASIIVVAVILSFIIKSKEEVPKKRITKDSVTTSPVTKVTPPEVETTKAPDKNINEQDIKVDDEKAKDIPKTKPEPPKPPTKEDVLSYLEGKMICNDFLFSRNAVKPIINLYPGKDGNYYANLSISPAGRNKIYSVNVVFAKIEKAYIFDSYTCLRVKEISIPSQKNPPPTEVFNNIPKDPPLNDKNYYIPSDDKIITEIKNKLKGKTKIFCNDDYPNPGESQLTDFRVKRRQFNEDSTGIKYTVEFRYKGVLTCTEEVRYSKAGKEYKSIRQ